MGYDNLMNFYKTNFNLIHHHKWSGEYLENMMPWERHLYVDLLKEHIKKEAERIRDLKAIQNRRNK